jgi:hypothetical protein
MIRQLLQSLKPGEGQTLQQLRERDGWRRWSFTSEVGYDRRPDGSRVCAPMSQRRLRARLKLSPRQWRKTTKAMRRQAKVRPEAAA